MPPAIVLLTDFGLSDHYVASMKGVILSYSPHSQIIDLSHDVEPQNVLQAALILSNAYRYFPKGTLFACVVDPGVGTSRKLVCVKTNHYYFIAPDNGLLHPIVKQEKSMVIRVIENKRFFTKEKASNTFHGRDIISPVAGQLVLKPSIIKLLGRRLRSLEPLKIPATQRENAKIKGEIIYFDRFGNAITNISVKDHSAGFWSHASVRLQKKVIGPIEKTYGKVSKKMRALFNSSNYLEIAVPGDSAQKRGRLKLGDSVIAVRTGMRK